jgi:CheY-like chemotaxis protein
MKLRILVFEDDFTIRKPICNFLRAKGHEVLDFPSPLTCALVADKRCACPREHACANLVITDMNMPGMTGLELIRMLADKGCHAPPQNKIVISSALTAGQIAEFRALGCHFLPKPFQLQELWKAVQVCEQTVAPDRQLAPLEDLWKTIRSQQ